MTKEELQEYYDDLYEKLNRGNPEFVLNDSRAHNSVIERFMLNSSNEIRMYCGEMSVFRKGFYEHINNGYGKGNDNDGGLLGDFLKQKLCESLSEFIAKPLSNLSIFLERYDSSFVKDLICPTLFDDGIKRKKICVYKLKDNLFLKNGVTHTSFTDRNIIRIERDPITHEAICAINSPFNIVENVKSMFDSIQKVSEEIKLFS